MNDDITYFLSEEQYNDLWYHEPTDLEVKEWLSKNNVLYSERLSEPGFWGMLTGSEKNINWLLLQL